MPEKPSNKTASVTITGAAKVGETLTAIVTDANGVPSAVAYQWYADSTAISGATSKTYTLLAAQAGKAITVTAIFTDNDGFDESVTSSASAQVVDDITGFLLLAYATTGTKYIAEYDVTNTTAPTWNEYFSDVLDFANLGYRYVETVATYGQVTSTVSAKIIELFDFDWILKIYGSNGSFIDDTHKWQFEILDANNNTLAAIKSEKDGDFKSGLWYGESLTNMTKAAQTGEYPGTNGELSFTKSKVIYTPSNTTNFNNSFIFDVDLSSAVKLRVSGSATATNTTLNSGRAGGYVRIIS